MKLTSTLTFTSLLALSIAREYYGTLSITSVDNSIIESDLKLINGTLHEGEYSTFYARDDGTIESYSSGEIMRVENGKKIDFTNNQGLNVNVTLAKQVREEQWSLQANGATVFQRCGYGSIGLNSDCEGAEKVYLHFFSMLSF